MKIKTIQRIFSIFSVTVLLYLLFSLTKGSNSIDESSFSEVNINKYYIIFLFIFNVAPILFYLSNKNEQELIPLFYFINIFFLLFYTLPNLLIVSELLEPLLDKVYEDKLNINNTNKLLLVGFFTFNLGYFLFYKIIFIKRKGFEILNITRPNEIFYLSILFIMIIVISFNIIEIQNLKSSFLMLKFPILYLALGLICYYLVNYYSKKNIFKVIILTTLYLFIIFQELLTGLLTFSFLLTSYFFIFSLFVKKKVNILLFFLIFFIMFTMQAYKDDYRKLIKYSQHNILYLDFNWGLKLIENNFKTIKDVKNASVEDLMSIDGMTVNEAKNLIRLAKNFNFTPNFFQKSSFLFGRKAIIKTFIENPLNDLNSEENLLTKKYKVSTHRLLHSYESLLVITKKTPIDVAFMKGDSYKYLIRGLVPGIFWKNKPQDNISHEAGIRYGVLWIKDCCTSWNLPILSEMYMNFGTKGIVIGMFILGFLTRILTLIFSIKNKNNFEYIIGFFCIIPLFYFETNASHLFGSFYKNYIFLMIMMLCYRYFLYNPFIALLKKLK